MPISLAGSGLLILIVEAVLGMFGITPEPGTVEQVLNSLIVAGGWLMLIIGQLRRRDLIAGLVRRFHV